MRRTGLSGVLALILAAIAIGVATAHEKTYKLRPKPTVTYTNVDTPREDPVDHFSGDLAYKGEEPLGGKHCVGDRTIRVIRLGAPSVKVGEAKTAADGTWKLEAEDVADGDYRAHTLKRRIKVVVPPGQGISGHIHRYWCLPARSATIHAGP
jgi:hypothetical protein